MKGLRFLIVILWLTACKTEEKKLLMPPGILSMDSTAMMLRDIHLLESSLMVSGIRQDSAQTLYRLTLEPELLRKYKTDTARLNRSLRFYASEPWILDSLYHLVLRKTDSAASANH